MTEHWIEHPSEPQRLALAWQAPDHMGERRRWAVGALYPKDGEIELRYLMGPEFEAYNAGAPFSAVEELGYRGYPGFALKKRTHCAGVAEALFRRLPPRTRSDFFEYKNFFRIRDELAISDLALLGHTQAHLPNDGFSVVDQLDPEATRCDLLLEVAGRRYYTDLPFDIEAGVPVGIETEPDNPFDPSAVKFTIEGRKIGNVNRLQADTFLHWISHRHIKAVVDRVNGKPERPRVLVFIRVMPRAERAAA